MATTQTTRKVASGYQTIINIGVDTHDGETMPGTADRSFTFWGHTQAEAVRKAQSFLEE